MQPAKEENEVAEKIELSERRNFKRFRLAQPVQCRLNDLESEHGSLSCDISEGGIRLNIAQFLPLNAEIPLQIKLDAERIFECRGRVMWIQRIPFSERYQAGLEFIKDEDFIHASHRIQDWIQLTQRSQSLKGV